MIKLLCLFFKNISLLFIVLGSDHLIFMGGGGARGLHKKSFPAVISGEENSPAQRADKKNSPACLRKRFRTLIPVFALQNPPFALRNLLLQSKICISHSANCFYALCKLLYAL